MLKENYHIAVPTSFSQNEELEVDNTINHVQNLYEQGIKSVLVCGTTGEQHSLTVAEKIELIEALDDHDVTKNMEILFGVSAVRQKDAVILAKAIRKSNIAGIMLGFPPYIVPTQDEMITYTTKVIEAGQKPTILYNNPPRTGFDLAEETMITLFNNVDLIIGVKEAGQKSNDSLAHIKKSCPGIFLYAGGEVNLESKLKSGFNRLSSILGNVDPEGIREWFNRLQLGEEDQLKDQKVTHLLQSLFTDCSVIIHIKEALNKQGTQIGICRSPLGIKKP
ncbi:dihydrodipicolinate synthase family protein [Aureibacillus halotolerans]|uniref:4-hydroxy-tetrahydrodipicolinate synthase n=1 Tax=Aureibacillus halotolerans TaxID=1508390 RepID=A0A4R6U7V3_9BACI|nr:dihydrodipicolinate synthase family protein [Aureibacillus halotolerans]TDQ40665.1 4-hydroxy-tetrahydrodipicolinate synthase [Aureibacillus halotolerans]